MKRIPLLFTNFCLLLRTTVQAFHSSSSSIRVSRTTSKSSSFTDVGHYHSSPILLSSSTNSDQALDEYIVLPSSPSLTVQNSSDGRRRAGTKNSIRSNVRKVGKTKKKASNNSNNSGVKQNTTIIPKKHRKLSDIFNEQREKESEGLPGPTSKQPALQPRKIISNINNNDMHQNEPWSAGYASSKATQKKIRAAASASKSNSSSSRDNNRRAISVLKTLLDTPPEWCNETNVVCALTLSAKLLVSPSNENKSSSTQLTEQQQQQKQLNLEKNRKEFRILLHQTLDVLHQLVKNQRLNVRQLANVSWAIAKHLSIDPHILPVFTSGTKNINRDLVYSKNNKSLLVMTSEEWNLLENDDDGDNEIESDLIAGGGTPNNDEKRLLVEILDEIAKSLIRSMSIAQSKEVEFANQSQHENIKVVEISMICWAYSTLYPRQCPAGWKFPACMGKMDDANTLNNNGDNENINYSRNKDTVLFEQWEQSTTATEDLEHKKKEPTSLVDQLFDVIALRLVWQKNDSFSTIIQQLNWKELSTIAWAYAHRGCCETEASIKMISHLADEAIHRLEIFDENNKSETISSRDISEIAWALGIFQTDNFVFSDALEDYLGVISSKFVPFHEKRPLREWAAADCVQLAVAMAHGRLDDPVLMKVIYKEALCSIKDELHLSPSFNCNKHFQSWELSILLWVQARLYLTKEIDKVFDDYADILPHVLLSRMKPSRSNKNELKSLNNAFTSIGLGSQEKANLCWSLTVLDKVNSPEATELIRNIFKDTAQSCSNGEQIKLEHAHQLWQSIFLLELPSDEIVTDQFISFLKTTWDKEKARSKASSARHKALSQTLHFMGVPHYNEHDEDIDVAIVLKTESKWLNAASKSEDLPESHSKVAVE